MCTQTRMKYIIFNQHIQTNQAKNISLKTLKLSEKHECLQKSKMKYILFKKLVKLPTCHQKQTNEQNQSSLLLVAILSRVNYYELHQG